MYILCTNSKMVSVSFRELRQCTRHWQRKRFYISNLKFKYFDTVTELSTATWFYLNEIYPGEIIWRHILPFSILEIFNIGICGIFFHDGEWGCGFGISGRGAGWEQPSGRSYCTVVFVTCDDLGICPLTVGFEGFTPTIVISGLRARGSFFS